MLVKTLETFKMIHDHTISSAKGPTWDITFLFQAMNTMILLLIFIGVPYLIYRMLKKNSVKREEIDLLNKKMDTIIEKLDER